MTNTELLAALGTLRGQVAQMTPEPWTHFYEDGEPSCEITVGDERIVWCEDGAHDAAGIAALRNAADELLAAAEALIGTHPSNRGPWCWCGYGRDVQNCGHGPQCKTARAALDRLAKKLEAANE